jgi:hypothetical protein
MVRGKKKLWNLPSSNSIGIPNLPKNIKVEYAKTEDPFWRKDDMTIEDNVTKLNDVDTEVKVSDIRPKMPEVAKTKEMIDHPDHYWGGDNPYETIKVIHAWELGFCLGNTVKYISRAGKKDPATRIEDLRKALWYLQKHIEHEVLNELDNSIRATIRNR